MNPFISTIIKYDDNPKHLSPCKALIVDLNYNMKKRHKILIEKNIYYLYVCNTRSINLSDKNINSKYTKNSKRIKILLITNNN